MKEIAPYRAAVAVIFAAWIACFGLSLDDVLRHTAYSPVLVVPAESPDRYPTVAVVRAGLAAGGSELVAGDRLLALADTSMRGAGSQRWVSALASFRGRDVEVPVTIDRGAGQQTIRMRPASHFRWWPRLVASLVFAGCALFLLVRLRQAEVVRALVVSNLAVACFMAGHFAGSLLETWASFFAQGLSIALVLPLTLRAFLLFPHGVRPRSRWARWGPWAFAAIGIFDTSLFWGTPFSHRIGGVGLGVLGVTYATVLVATLTRSYRISDAIGRRRLKWVVFGAYLASIPAALAQGFTVASPALAWLVAISISGVVVLPLCILIAITRYNFLDIDRVLTSTASLSVLLVALLATLTFVVPTAAATLSAELGIHAATARLFLLAALAVPLIPAHRGLRTWIERIFVAERYQLDSGIAQLAQRLSDCETPEQLARMAGDGLAAQLRPKSCVVYSRTEDVLAPAFVRGNIDPPRFVVGSPLVAALEEQQGPLALEGVPGGDGQANLGAFQRAVLDTLGASVVVPVRLEGSLVAFLCLGEKVSGDVYTRGDLALLALICDKVAGELRRFEQRELLEASHALQARLRRYVPGTLADQLERGEELEAGERMVSVLFVDLRGYAGYAENLETDQIFSTVSRYTATVSSLIKEHGGTVVEFNGDGMMAVFGAPKPLELKEEAAVAAGRAIVEQVPEVAGRLDTLSVGVGIATGSAFVGDVHAADRRIWTALGNTTNLASRLQSLTRDLGAAMIIDEATWQRSGEQAQSFSRHGEVHIRGRQRTETLYVMPAPIPAGA